MSSKICVLFVLLFGVTSIAQEPQSSPSDQRTSRISRREARTSCLKDNPGLKGGALGKCIKEKRN